jgi:hypothetical protein
VKADFNYERQNQVIVTVKAQDLKPHVAYAQITVNVTDINDEKPELHMVRMVTTIAYVATVHVI